MFTQIQGLNAWLFMAIALLYTESFIIILPLSRYDLNVERNIKQQSSSSFTTFKAENYLFGCHILYQKDLLNLRNHAKILTFSVLSCQIHQMAKYWYFLFFTEIGFDISCKLSLFENLHEISIYVFLERLNKIFQNIICWNFHQACRRVKQL